MVNSVSSYNQIYVPNGGYKDFTYNPYYTSQGMYGGFETQAKPQEDNAAKTLGLAALLQGIALIIKEGSKWCSYKLQNGKEFTTFDNVKKVADTMVKDNKLNVNVGYIDSFNKAAYANKYGQALAGELDVVARGENAFFTKEFNLAVAPKSKPSLILHELGHAINSTKGKFVKFLQNSRKYAPYAPTALLLLSTAIPKQDGEKQNFIQRNAGILGFAAFLPTIIEEGMASFRGIKSAKNVLGKKVNLTPLRCNYALALGTYILAGIGLGIASKQTILESGQS